MRLFITLLFALIADAAMAAAEYPNKPGKKQGGLTVFGAQAGPAAPPPASDVVIGARSTRTKQGGGDYGFVAPALTGRGAAGPAGGEVGFRRREIFRNKAPGS